MCVVVLAESCTEATVFLNSRGLLVICLSYLIETDQTLCVLTYSAVIARVNKRSEE